VQSEAVEQEYTVIQATRHYGTCFERLEQWRRLEHPNIRHMLAMGFHTGDTLVMVFEGPKNASDIWLENMASLRAQNWDGFIRDILDTALGCVRGLSFLHQNRMINGDVKPSNLCGHGVNISLMAYGCLKTAVSRLPTLRRSSLKTEPLMKVQMYGTLASHWWNCF
jgi:hypothetical protein